MLGVDLRPRLHPATSSDRSMPLSARVYSKDEELGKRDDDFKPKRHSKGPAFTLPWRWRKRRVLAVLAMVGLIYLFIHNMPEPLGPIKDRLQESYRPHLPYREAGDGTKEPIGPPPRTNVQRDSQAEQHYHDGPIKFFRLATSLHGISRTAGSKQLNRNILFAASSLSSAANLMPMACEMAKWDRNYVHMAFLGRDALPLEDILEVNGVQKADCDVYFHDARSDYSEYSSDHRAEVAVAGAMRHVNEFMHPQAIIMDDSALEDAFFTRAMRGKANELGRALIEVPAGRYEEFLWMTRLDSGSLSNWFKPNIDVLVHALPGSSGGLLRTIHSLQNADYDGLKVPRLTIEVASDVEPFAQRFLASLDWPPGGDDSPMKASTLTLRHRIPSARSSSEQASLRVLESFYPADSNNDHLLVLSPQAELSSQYLQYLHYAILEYHYSSYGSPGAEELLGISLDVPFTFLNGTKGFVPPSVADMNAQKYHSASAYDQTALSPFLYEAPSSTATLIFGDKWATLHSFLSHRLESSHLGKATRAKKLVSETEPAWLEYLLELMRARGWSLLMPPSPFVTVHNELAQIPEEFTKPKSASQKISDAAAKSAATEEAFLTADEAPAMIQRKERSAEATQPLHELLPLDGDLPELPHLPHLSHAGDIVSSKIAARMRDEYLPIFRRTIGGCEAAEATRKRIVRDGKTDDLFCLPGIDVEYLDADEEMREAQAARAAEMVEALELPPIADDAEELDVGVEDASEVAAEDVVPPEEDSEKGIAAGAAAPEDDKATKTSLSVYQQTAQAAAAERKKAREGR